MNSCNKYNRTRITYACPKESGTYGRPSWRAWGRWSLPGFSGLSSGSFLLVRFPSGLRVAPQLLTVSKLLLRLHLLQPLESLSVLTWWWFPLPVTFTCSISTCCLPVSFSYLCVCVLFVTRTLSGHVHRGHWNAPPCVHGGLLYILGIL